MSEFRYIAANQLGQTVRGRVQADTPGAADAVLDRQGLIPLQLSPTFSFAAWKKRASGGVRWPIEDKILFTQKLASLLKAGIPILTVLKLVASQTKNPRVAAAIRRVGDQISEGSTFSDALAHEPGLFDRVYLGAIRAGESTGRLDSILEQTSHYLEREMDTRRKIKETLRYPIMVVIAMFIAGAIILKFVVPQFLTFYANFHADLPLPTRILMAIAEWFNRLWWVVGLVITGLGVGFWKWTKTPRGARWLDLTLLRLPIAGSLFLKVAVSRFCRLFGVLFSAGVPATSALDTVSEGVGNIIVSEDVNALRARIVQGESVMPRPPDAVMPELVYQMIAIGFESGDVDRMLTETARHFEQEVDYDVRRLNDRIQPVLLALLAVGVLFLALAVLLPMWNLISIVRQ
jgi:type II secretory pathway component PulF